MCPVLSCQSFVTVAIPENAKEVTVGRLPYGYEPRKCKPPYCNPFVHHVGVGVEVEQGNTALARTKRKVMHLSGDDSFFIGGLDFPLPIGKEGAGVRFPLSGAVEQGTSPFAYVHGHAFNPATPFDWKTIDNDRPLFPIRRKQAAKLRESNQVDGKAKLGSEKVLRS